MRKILPLLGGLILLLALGTSSSAQAAVRPAVVEPCSLNGPYPNPILDYHTSLWSSVQGGNLLFNTNNGNVATAFCLHNLGGSEFEIVDYFSGGCLSINSMTLGVTEEPYAGCQLNGGHGYVWDRWYLLSTDTSTHTAEFANMYYTNGLPEYTPSVGCMYGDTRPAEYVFPCNTSPDADRAEWFEWAELNI